MPFVAACAMPGHIMALAAALCATALNMRTRRATTEIEMIAAAHLKAASGKKGVSDSEIAERLDLSPSRISRLLADAREAGMLRPEVFDRSMIDDETFARVEERIGLPSDLRQRINAVSDKPLLQEVRIVFGEDTEAPEDNQESRNRARRNFGNEAAAHICHYLRMSKVVGIAWGRDCAAVLRAVPAQWWGKKDEEITVFPVRGEPIGYHDLDYSPSTLAGELQRQLTGSINALSLLGIPAIVPPLDPNPAEDRRLRDDLERYFLKFEDYQKICGSSPCLLDEVRCIVCSCGPVDALSPFTRRCFDTSLPPDPKTLEQAIVGDIAGVLLPRSSASAGTVGMWNERWIGIKRTHFEACVVRAADRPKDCAGPVLCAWDAAKAEAVVEACCRNLVSRLVLSSAIAAEVNRLVP